MSDPVLLSTAYWPNLHYFYYVLNAEQVLIEHHEHYQKQSFRNRTRILSANGVLDLNIPVKKGGIEIGQVEISYKEKWQVRHWRAITSAYKNSPYFDFFEDEIKTFYGQEFQFLLDYNSQQLLTILRILRIRKNIEASVEYEKNPRAKDLRNLIHPKVNPAEDPEVTTLLQHPYYQTFEGKFPFTPNLSILDLLFNTGLETVNYLKRK